MKGALLAARFALLAAAARYSLLAPSLHAQESPNVDRFVSAVMAEFEVPGLGLAIVKDGRVVVAKGYGVRSLGTRDAVDAHTLFGIASNTKLFTATALSMLAEQGKLELDSPVVRYLPWFLMSDTALTRQITVRDLLVHRSGLGLGAGDLMWWPQTDIPRQEIVRRLRYLPLEKPFRKAYAYDNVLYSVAGEVVRAVTRIPWEPFVERNILRRIGMTGSNVEHSAAGKAGNVARTHARVDGRVVRIAPMTGDNTNPAGGINASPADMAKWLIVQLDSGRLPDGSRLYSSASARQLWKIETPIPFGDPSPDMSWNKRTYNGYGLGIGVRDYRGVQMLLHTGSLPGYASRVMMIPSLRLGIAVLTNQEFDDAHDAIAYHIVDSYLGATGVDHLKVFAEAARKRIADANDVERESVVTRDSTRKPSLPLARYAATYADKWYGQVAITHESGQLEIRFSRTPALVGRLEHWEGDIFVARWRDRTLRADAFVTFHLAADRSVARVSMKAISPLTDFSYDFHDLDLRRERFLY